MNRFLSSTARLGGSSLFSHATTSASVVSVSTAASLPGPALRCTTILAARRLSSVADSSSSSSSSNDHDDDDNIKVGTVQNFGLKGGFGFILPDGVDKRTYHAKDLIFIHRNDIIVASETKTGEARYYPSLKRGQRVQYKVGAAPDGALTGKAYDLTYEGGELVPPFQKGYLEGFIKKQKAMFGDEVYSIFTTSKDQKELEMKIVAAFDRIKGNIEKQSAKVAAAAAAGSTSDDE